MVSATAERTLAEESPARPRRARSENSPGKSSSNRTAWARASSFASPNQCGRALVRLFSLVPENVPIAATRRGAEGASVAICISVAAYRVICAAHSGPNLKQPSAETATSSFALVRSGDRASSTASRLKSSVCPQGLAQFVLREFKCPIAYSALVKTLSVRRKFSSSQYAFLTERPTRGRQSEERMTPSSSL